MTEQELNVAIDLIRNMDTFERGGRPCGWMPNYTTNVADAWVLVAEMVKDERVAIVKVWCDHGQWFCEVDEEYGEWYASTRRHFEYNDPSAPLVIAKCYYKWRTHDRTS